MDQMSQVSLVMMLGPQANGTFLSFLLESGRGRALLT